MLFGFSSPAIAQESESCGDILRYATRDVRHDVSFSDQRKYFYQKVCHSSGSGIDFKDASSTLGLSFTSKDDYCKSEQSFNASTSYNQIDSSLVVRNSLDAYVACRALKEKGVNTSLTVPPRDNPTVFSISVQRRSVTPQTVDSVAFDPAAVSCNSQNNGQVQTFDKEFNVVKFQFPETEAQWSLVCTRKSTSDINGNKTYGPVQLVLTKSAGGLPIYLRQIGYASGTWTTELKREADSISKRITSVETTLNTQKIMAQCGGDGWLPRPPAPSCPPGYKDSGQFTHSAPGGRAGFGGHCRICLGN